MQFAKLPPGGTVSGILRLYLGLDNFEVEKRRANTVHRPNRKSGSVGGLVNLQIGGWGGFKLRGTEELKNVQSRNYKGISSH